MNRYITKRAYIIAQWHRFNLRLGRFRKYREIDWKKVSRVVFVCTGNVCRSPYAEALSLKAGLAAASAGIIVERKVAADATGQVVAKARGVELGDHESKSLSAIEIHDRDLLVAMEPWQAQYLTRFAESPGVQVTLLGLWMINPKPDIVDPLGGNRKNFDACYDDISDAMVNIQRRIGKTASPPNNSISDDKTT